MIGAAKAFVADDVGMIIGQIALQEIGGNQIALTLAIVNLAGARDGRSITHVADVVFVGLEGHLVRLGQGMKPARGFERGIDQVLRHAMAADIEKADILGRELQLLRHRLQCTWFPR